jgi:uncharacterized protein
MTTLSPVAAAKRDRLLSTIREYGSCAVALSGGVDSAVVAQAAFLALGDRAVAMTGQSDSLAETELDEARHVAQQIGIRHEIITTDEFANPDYLKNAPDRCYHCKTELYGEMTAAARRLGVAVLVNGANADDLGDYRPGVIAANEHAVKSPLVECDIHKSEVRELAQHWNLPTWDKPAAPCLSSRIAYGEEVTPQRLAMIDAAEQFLREQGLRTVRVRYHKGDVARVEVPQDALVQLCDEQLRNELVARLKSLGFKFITLDLEGFRSGSLNEALSIVQLKGVEGRA